MADDIGPTVIGGDKRAFGGRHGDEEIVVCFGAVYSQRANDANWYLGEADEVFDIAGKCFWIWQPNVSREAVDRYTSLFEECLSFLQSSGGMIIPQRDSVAEWFRGRQPRSCPRANWCKHGC